MRISWNLLHTNHQSEILRFMVLHTIRFYLAFASKSPFNVVWTVTWTGPVHCINANVTIDTMLNIDADVNVKCEQGLK